MRGKRYRLLPIIGFIGSIPARAGETTQCQRSWAHPRVYPRPCGGNVLEVCSLVLISGLSPPVRGKPASSPPPAGRLGSIPARAGETPMCTLPMALAEVYPRPCGGNLPPPQAPALEPGSIPARAGETVACRKTPPRTRVYPRPCGGNQTGRAIGMRVGGLSPPVRGKHGPGSSPMWILGSIPARAGETTTKAGGDHLPKVYPRPCGGNAIIAAGQVGQGVYPRPCGGNDENLERRMEQAGLSPPVRGKLSNQRRDFLHRGSIPARAGETLPVASA